MVETVALQVVDIGVDSGIPPVKKDTRLGEFGEGLVGIGIVHAVVAFFITVPHRIIDHVTTLLAIRPYIVGIPEYLWGPHTVDGAPVFIGTGRLTIAEDGIALTVIKRDTGPMDEVITLQEVNAIVVPVALLTEGFSHAVVHVRRHHHKTLAVPTAGDISIALTTFNTGMFLRIHHRITAQNILVMIAVTTECKGRILPTIAHVTIQIAIVAFLHVLCSGNYGYQ